MKKINYIYIILFCAIFKMSYSQDNQYTQIYALPMYINPAYTGNTESHRAALKYRNQWPGVNKAFSSMAASYDFNNFKRNSGFGLMYMRNNAGLTAMTLNNIRLLYAYTLKINETQFLKFGINIDYNRKEMDLKRLVFNDQLYTQSATSLDQIYNPTINYFDAGTGALYNYENFWAGLSVNHLNRPSTSTIDRKARLPMYWHANAGIRLINSRVYEVYSRYGFLWASYRHQAKFNQLDIGANYVMNNLTVGLVYRGIPIREVKFVDRNDALAFNIGFNLINYNMRFAYSYDLTISRLASKSSGSHEVSLIFERMSKNKFNFKVLKIVCPEF